MVSISSAVIHNGVLLFLARCLDGSMAPKTRLRVYTAGSGLALRRACLLFPWLVVLLEQYYKLATEKAGIVFQHDVCEQVDKQHVLCRSQLLRPIIPTKGHAPGRQ